VLLVILPVSNLSFFTGVCQATVILIVQLLVELGQPEAVDPFLSRCYPILRLCPVDVFVTWCVAVSE
jgi:hypothetical protein